ncbi:hypothetical protein RclHR1_02150006 [Rhizophagus clarus]|uniref:DNA-directed DNA polymerase n=1 Tax=Rhizophagus clarus TaxID=94130 RepID=A0A2Z6R643_9GLOM|nr:hypothetical protein RclHR1_02150006 [Rhizophagus clarus]
MNTSLVKLAENLGTNKPITKKHFKDLRYTDKHVNLITHKGVYPYDYIDSHVRFLETELPPFHEFHSTLKGKITQEDYERAQKVWNEFGCKNLGEYHDIYLKLDVLLLTDIWTEFRKVSMESDRLDPSHYTSLPALSWDSMLKMIGVKIELFTDMDMHDFIEKAKCGGLSMAVHRYFQANNPKMGEAFNPSKPTSWISYVDATNLYGWGMSEYLPIGDYKWEVNRKYLKGRPDAQKKWLDIALRTKADSRRGLYLGVNSHFPYKTHDYLSNLPLAVENIAVGKDWLSPYNAELVEDIDEGRFAKTEKLIPHLGKRNYYVIHYRELQYYVKLGMIVDEVTGVLSFEQSNWLAPYIALNTEKCNEAKKAGNTFLSDFYKLKNNACYEKTMENVRKYQDVKLMRNINERDERAFLNKICSPRFKYGRQLGNTLIEAHMGKASVTLNKPIIIGASVLGLSKLYMYEFWYGYVKEKYDNLFNLNGDTTIGKFKDETPGNVITESYHIRAKSYHYVLADKSTQSKHKGVSKKGMSEMATNSYMPALEGSLLDDPINRSSMTEQEARDLAMRTKADPMTLVYRDCLFRKEVFHAKNVNGITTLPYNHWHNMIYKNMIKDGISHKEAEKRAIRAKLPAKYQNECTFHIVSDPLGPGSLDLNATEIIEAKELPWLD